jgi:hypothetical protein
MLLSTCRRHFSGDVKRLCRIKLLLERTVPKNWIQEWE